MKPAKFPKGAIKPRPAVLSMAPYSPPTGGRAGKLRLDFNENTVGCSPRVIAALQQRIDAGALTIYPEYSEARQTTAACAEKLAHYVAAPRRSERIVF